jgi:hypothetical protein
LQPLTGSALGASRASSATPCGTRSAATLSRLRLKSVLGRGKKNQKKNERMRKKRGGEFLPPPLSLYWNPDRRPVTLFYVAGAAGVSFGDIPMTFTPAPRATSIAKITSEYFTFGSPFTKMIFSVRPS